MSGGAGFQKKGKPFDPRKPFAWSYSKLKNFETCPKRHYHVDVVGDWGEPESQQLKDGNALHDAMARAIGNVGGKVPDGSDARPLPDSLKQHESLVLRHRERRAVGAVVATELKLAINARFEPVDWFARDAWYRGIFDVLVTFQKVALADDWKTGKVVDDSPQLRMGAVTLLAHNPGIELVHTRFIWLKEDSTTEERVARADAPRVWADLAPRVEQLRVAYANPNPEEGFPATPSFLCRKWCPVKACKFYGT